ncbi:MAG: YlxR family protein [candidate division KSB1 bacterium]
MRSKIPPASKPYPQRTCLGCGLKTEQKNLLRLVRLQDETVAIDLERRRPGRGCYVCPRLECAHLLRRKKALTRGFRANVAEAVYTEIIAYVEQHASS